MNQLQRVYTTKRFLESYEYSHMRFYGSLYFSVLLQQTFYYWRHEDYRERFDAFPFFAVILDLFKEKAECGTLRGQSNIDCAFANPVVWGSILALPVVWGMGKVWVHRHQASHLDDQRLTQLEQFLTRYRPHLFRDTLRWFFPRYHLHHHLDLLVRTLCWDGRVTADRRYELFQSLKQWTQRAHYLSQIEGMYSLAKVADSVALKDFPMLLKAGYSKEAMLTLLRIKTEALIELASYSPSGTQKKGERRRAAQVN